MHCRAASSPISWVGWGQALWACPAVDGLSCHPGCGGCAHRQETSVQWKEGCFGTFRLKSSQRLSLSLFTRCQWYFDSMFLLRELKRWPLPSEKFSEPFLLFALPPLLFCTRRFSPCEFSFASVVVLRWLVAFPPSQRSTNQKSLALELCSWVNQRFRSRAPLRELQSQLSKTAILWRTVTLQCQIASVLQVGAHGLRPARISSWRVPAEESSEYFETRGLLPEDNVLPVHSSSLAPLQQLQDA